jgi:hypothetical protein
VDPPYFGWTANGAELDPGAIVVLADRVWRSERRGRTRRPKGCVRVWRFKRNVQSGGSDGIAASGGPEGMSGEFSNRPGG